MKKWVARVLLLVFIISMAACAKTETEAPITTSSVTTESTTQSTSVPTESAVTEATTEPTETETVPAETVPPTETTVPETTAPEETEPEPDVDPQLIVKVSDYITDIRQNLYYATKNNIAGEPVYDFDEAYLRFGTVAKLKKVSKELAKQGIGLMIWDGFRPMSAQAKLWEACPNSAYVSNPVTGSCSHCRGSAVDLTLIDLETGEELEMPSAFDDFTKQGDRDYSDCSDEAAANAQLLEEVMVKYGFKPYSKEWWHYSDTDFYEIESYYDPAMETLWYATCNESMSLRKSASTESRSLATIRAKETMEVIGWSQSFAKVRYKDKIGYVLTYYIKPVNESFFEENLDTVEFVNTYTYEAMMKDIASLKKAYSGSVTVENIGTSELGKNIPVIRIGSKKAKNHILLHASIHGREHPTTWLLMALVDYWLDHGMLGYGDVCYHIIPMVNPDGVAISQTGKLNAKQKEIYKRDLALGYTDLSMNEYARLWKANGLGVDLNRNFDAGWGYVDNVTEPSSALYAGESAFSASEAKALRDYTLAYPFKATISFHSAGSVLYYRYGNNTKTNNQSMKLAQKVKEFSGYPLLAEYAVDAGGYKDWTIESLGIPSLTVEIGGSTPLVPSREMESIFLRTYSIFPAVALWVQK